MSYLPHVYLLMALFGSAASNYPQCPNTVDTGKLNSVVISDCEPSSVCVLKKGTTKKIDVSFTPSSDSEKLETHVSALVAEVELPFLGFQIDACDPKRNIQCPLKANTVQNYTNEINVLPLYPTMKTQVTWHMKDAAGKTIVCFVIKSRITD